MSLAQIVATYKYLCLQMEKKNARLEMLVQALKECTDKIYLGGITAVK
jgi:hypothetical protein